MVPSSVVPSHEPQHLALRGSPIEVFPEAKAVVVFFSKLKFVQVVVNAFSFPKILDTKSSECFKN